MMLTDVPLPPEDITETRQTTHGSFNSNAVFSQALKNEIRSTMGSGWQQLPPEQREALDMIALKLSRIVSGKAFTADHWLDIAGYATLGMKACKK